jgi:chemotaxis protein MotB
MSHGGDDGLPEEHEEHVNHEAWVIPYADLLTLLMAMFIALFAISTVDTGKFKALARGFSSALGGGKLDTGIGGSGKATSPAVGGGNGNGPFTGGQLIQTDSAEATKTQLAQFLNAHANAQVAQSQERATLSSVEQQIKNAAAAKGFGGALKLELKDNGLVVTLVSDKVLFDSGSGTLRPESAPLLKAIADALKQIPNDMTITGYTDSVPFHGPHGNDVLSFDRALSVKDFLVAAGVPDARMQAGGQGARNFVDTNATLVGRQRNRRVEIVVQSKLIKRVLDANGLSGKPATPTTSPIQSPATTPIAPVGPGINTGLG